MKLLTFLKRQINHFVATKNATCIKLIGVFTVLETKQTYLNSIKNCQNIGGDLADATTEIRTNRLSNIVNNSLDVWYKVAYIGLDDHDSKNEFVTVAGKPLRCIKYRAWAPGHPRFEKRLHEHCVVLDTNSMWRVVECHQQFPAVCEIFPTPFQQQLEPKNVDCDNISNKGTVSAYYIIYFIVYFIFSEKK